MECKVAANQRSRISRGWALATSHRAIAGFAGGYAAAASIAIDLLRARGLGAMLDWATTAAAYGRYLDARQYRAWLKSRPSSRGCGRLLVAASTLGIDPPARSAFLHLLANCLRCLPQGQHSACVLLADRSAGALFQTLPGIDLLDVSVASVEKPTLQALLAAVRARAEAFDYVALLKPGYLPGAIAVPAESSSNAFLYGDEDRIDAAGARSQPFFKPSFSPDLLLVRDYLGCLLLPSALATTLDDAEDYHSLVLRLVERAASVARLDAVLAHRFAPTAASTDRLAEDAGRLAEDAGRREPAYLGQFLRNRYGPSAKVSLKESAELPWRCDFGNRDASVSVILPTRDRLPLLRQCVQGIFRSNRGDFEVIVLDNGSTQPETVAWLARAGDEWPRLRVVPAPGSFNWSRLNNLGMSCARGEVFVFLNNDTEPRCRDWLARLADVALRSDVGAVGALLLYPNGRIQHAGMVVGDGRWTDHIYRGDFPSSNDHALAPPNLPRNVSAVTGACMAMARRTVERIGPFDEGYRVAGSDVEMCIRALRHGYLNVYLPDVALLHLESQTRGRWVPASDTARLAAFLQANSAKDPYFSSHLNAAPLYLSRRSVRSS